ncbi:MAG TPA: hypothetical protein VGD46_15535 [Rhizobacter sp.]
MTEPVTITIGGKPMVELLRLRPDSDVWALRIEGFSDRVFYNYRAALRVALKMHDAGYDVRYDGRPLVPTTGFWGWVHRRIDSLNRYLHQRTCPQCQKNSK